MARLYRYLGPDPARLAAGLDTPRWPLATPDDARRVLELSGVRKHGGVTCTFVVVAEGLLFVADRQSEHIACARGSLVLSAGELRLSQDARGPLVTEATNQSTGFCPEPSSWPALAHALDHAGLRHPGAFTTEFTFRRCDACQTTNLVKDGWFVCDSCDAPLAERWNFDDSETR